MCAPFMDDGNETCQPQTAQAWRQSLGPDLISPSLIFLLSSSFFLPPVISEGCIILNLLYGVFVCEGGAQLQWAVTVLGEHVSVSERINVRESVFERLCVW